jgi:methylmalonyl-CoA/ethylmalonyl-CoA epimerase
MKLGRLNHIGVATPSIEKSVAYYRDVMGATKIYEPFDLPAQGVKVCFVDTPGEGGPNGPTAGTQIELIEPLGEASPIHGFIAKNPAGGQHHMCYEVPDIHAAKAWFEGKGAKVLGEPRIGAHGTLIFFVHPKDMNGVLTEIMETPKDGAGH